MEKVIIDMELFGKLGRVILDEVHRSGRAYRAILCPLRGGFFLSYYMGRHLGLPLEYVQISSYDDFRRREFQIGIRSELSGDPFLLCDDIYDSGHTIGKIRSLYPGVTFDTACLVSKVEVGPTYCGMRVARDVWVEFFWEIL